MRIEILRSAAILLLIALAGCGRGGGSTDTGSPIPVRVGSDPALAMVERTGLGNGLTRLAIAAAQRTGTYGQLNAKLGPGAYMLYQHELSALLPKYQPQWNKNLAECYAAHMTQQEMQSIAIDGRRSHSADKLMSLQASIAADMQTKSSSLLKDLVTEALANAAKKSGASSNN